MNGAKTVKEDIFLNQRLVGSAGSVGRNRKEEIILTKLWNGHSGRNSSCCMIGKSNNERVNIVDRKKPGTMFYCSARGIIQTDKR